MRVAKRAPRFDEQRSRLLFDLSFRAGLRRTRASKLRKRWFSTTAQREAVSKSLGFSSEGLASCCRSVPDTSLRPASSRTPILLSRSAVDPLSAPRPELDGCLSNASGRRSHRTFPLSDALAWAPPGRHPKTVKTRNRPRRFADSFCARHRAISEHAHGHLARGRPRTSQHGTARRELRDEVARRRRRAPRLWRWRRSPRARLRASEIGHISTNEFAPPPGVPFRTRARPRQSAFFARASPGASSGTRVARGRSIFVNSAFRSSHRIFVKAHLFR